MSIFIILLGLFLFGILLVIKDYPIGGILSSICGLWLIIHCIIWVNVPYSFNSWVEQRDAFETTLHNARKNGNPLEAAAIIKEVAEWNQSLAKNKYENTLWIYDWCIDDRVEKLEPIK